MYCPRTKVSRLEVLIKPSSGLTTQNWLPTRAMRSGTSVSRAGDKHRLQVIREVDAFNLADIQPFETNRCTGAQAIGAIDPDRDHLAAGSLIMTGKQPETWNPLLQRRPACGVSKAMPPAIKLGNDSLLT